MRKKTPEQYLNEPYGRLIIRDGPDMFSAEISEFPGCFAQGTTAEEAYRNLEEAAKSWIEIAQGEGHEIPPPASSHGYSGHFHLRMPRSLHRLAAMRAVRDGISLNQCIATAIAAWVGADDLYYRTAEQLATVARSSTSQASITVNVFPRQDETHFVPLRPERTTVTQQDFRRFLTQEVANG